MNNEKRALLILFDGEEPEVKVVNDIADIIVNNCSTTDINIYGYCQKDIAAAILSAGYSSNINISPEVNIKPADIITIDRSPEEEAVIFIGTILQKQLSKDNNLVNIVKAVLQNVKAAKANPELESSKQFMNALFILSQPDLHISKRLLNRYNMNNSVIDLITSIYNNMKNY